MTYQARRNQFGITVANFTKSDYSDNDDPITIARESAGSSSHQKWRGTWLQARVGLVRPLVALPMRGRLENGCPRWKQSVDVLPTKRGNEGGLALPIRSHSTSKRTGKRTGARRAVARVVKAALPVCFGATLPSIAAETATTGFPPQPSCQVMEAPADAGAVATPGGFMLVHPRNDRIADGYSGCKTLWIFDDPEAPRRWATLLFEKGRLMRAVIWDRDAPDRPDRVCDRTQPAAESCSGVEGNELVALRLSSWPRACMSEPEREECRSDPR